MPATKSVHHTALIDCALCGTLHLNTVPCPWGPGRDNGVADDIAMSNAFAEREAEQERAAYTAKMERDAELAARPAPRRVNQVNAIGTKLDKSAKGKTWAAKYPGTICANCHTAIELGDLIMRANGKGYRHVDCPVNAAPAAPAAAPREREASDKQINLITTLQVERGVPAEAPEGLTFAEASTEISRLIALPKISAGKTRIDLNGLREGRYAVNTEDGVLAFYNVTERGVFVQASDALHMVPGAAAMQSIIAKILVDPAEAARTYGRELGKCAVCGRTLTDDDSRAHGIGPICRKKTGW